MAAKLRKRKQCYRIASLHKQSSVGITDTASTDYGERMLVFNRVRSHWPDEYRMEAGEA